MDEKKMKELLKRAHSSQEAPPFEIVWRQAVRSSSSPSRGRGVSLRVKWVGLGLAGAVAAVAVALFVAGPTQAPSPPLDGKTSIATRSPSKGRDTGATSKMDALVASLKDLEIYEDYAWAETEEDVFDEDDESVLASASDAGVEFEGLFDDGPTDFLLEIDFGEFGQEDEERNLL